MKEHRIITYHMKDSWEKNPWTAFFFNPEFENQEPNDFVAKNFSSLAENGNVAFGETEASAVSKLFHNK